MSIILAMQIYFGSGTQTAGSRLPKNVFMHTKQMLKHAYITHIIFSGYNCPTLLFFNSCNSSDQ